MTCATSADTVVVALSQHSAFSVLLERSVGLAVVSTIRTADVDVSEKDAGSMVVARSVDSVSPVLGIEVTDNSATSGLVVVCRSPAAAAVCDVCVGSVNGIMVKTLTGGCCCVTTVCCCAELGAMHRMAPLFGPIVAGSMSLLVPPTLAAS